MVSHESKGSHTVLVESASSHIPSGIKSPAKKEMTRGLQEIYKKIEAILEGRGESIIKKKNNNQFYHVLSDLL